MSNPSPTGRIVDGEPLVGKHALAEPAQGVGVGATGLARRRSRDAAAPQDVVGGHQRAPGQPPIDEGVEIRLVLRLQRVDECHVERAGQRRLRRRERLEGLGADDGDALVPDAGVSPPATGEVGPLPVGIDGDDRAVRRLAQGHPQRRVTVGRSHLDDATPVTGQHRQDAAGVAVDDRDVARLGGGLDGDERGRLGRRRSTRSSRDPWRRGSSRGRPSSGSLHHTSRP